MSSREVVLGMLGIARALDLLGKNGKVHGDLAPRNILIDALGSWVLADFGLARTCVEVAMDKYKCRWTLLCSFCSFFFFFFWL